MTKTEKRRGTKSAHCSSVVEMSLTAPESRWRFAVRACVVDKASNYTTIDDRLWCLHAFLAVCLFMQLFLVLF